MKKMLKYLVVSIVLLSVKIHCVSLFCQGIDTICLPVSKVKSLVIAAEQGKNAIDKVKVYEIQVSTLNERIDGLNKIIVVYKEKEGNYEQIIKQLEDQKAIYVQEKVLYENRIASLQNDLIKQKKKTKRIGFLGLAGTIGGFVLGVLLSK